MRKSERLKVILNLAKKQENKAAAEMRDALTLLGKLENSLKGLHQYQAEYQTSWCDSVGKKFSIHQLNQYRNFLAQIDSGIHQQKQQIEQARIVVIEKKQHWLAKYKRSQALSKTLENYRKIEQSQEQRKEQKLHDEFATRHKFSHKL